MQDDQKTSQRIAGPVLELIPAHLGSTVSEALRRKVSSEKHGWGADLSARRSNACRLQSLYIWQGLTGFFLET
jgi:hypothetical protein